MLANYTFLKRPAIRVLMTAMICGICLVGLPDAARADVLTKVGTFTAISGTGDQSISGVGFQPKAVLFWYTDRTSAGAARYARFGQGWATGPSDQGAVSTAWSDGESNSDNMRSISVCMDSLVIAMTDHLNNILAAASLESMDSDGFTLNWGFQGGVGGSRKIIYLALGGSSLMAKAGGEVIPEASTGSPYDISVGFQPDVVLMAGVEDMNQFFYSSRGGFGFGVATSSTRRQSSAHRWRDRENGSQGTSGIVDDQALIYADDSTTPEDSYDLVGMRSSGFRLERTGEGEVSAVIYLALAGLDVAHGILTEPGVSGSGSQTITGLGFQPSALLFHGGDTQYTGIWDVYGEYVAGIAADSANQAGIWAGCDDDNSDTALSLSDALLSYDADSSSPNSKAHLNSMNSGGFTLGWSPTDGGQRKIGWIAFGGSGSSVFSASPSSMSLMVGEDKDGSANGGSSPYTVSTSNSSVATVSLGGNSFTVTGVAAGTATITVSDDVGDSHNVSVTVNAPLTADPTTAYLIPSTSTTITVSGGFPGYSVVSGNTVVAQATISGDIITLTGVGTGTVTITVTDQADNHVYIAVTVGDSITPGLGDCPVPPFTTATVGPNVMIVFDSSGSMETDDENDGKSRFAEAREAIMTTLDANPNIRFGLTRLDGPAWSAEDRPGGLEAKHGALVGGRVLVPCGYSGHLSSSAEYIKWYLENYMVSIDQMRSDHGLRLWTALAETLTDVGRYFATVVDSDGNRVGKGPAGFGYYKEGTDYTHYWDYDTDGDLDPFLASITDDVGNTIDTISPIAHACEQAFVVMFTDGRATTDNNWDLVTDYIGDYDGDNESSDCPRADPLAIRPSISDPNNSNYGRPASGLALGSYSCDTREDTNDGDEPGAATYLDDVAKFLYDADLRSDIPGIQNVITYTIGFHVNSDLLQEAADHGHGQYFTADSLDQLTTALQLAMEDILLTVASGTAVSTITTSSSSDDYLVRAKFFPGNSWQGYLERFTLPYTDGMAADWEAGALLNARIAADGHGDRDIYTYLDSTKTAFVSSDSSVKDDMELLWGVSSTDAADMINYLRGDTTHDGGKYKDRHGWLLGDIVYSRPTPVGPPRGWYFDNPFKDPAQEEELYEYASYQDFKYNNIGRKTMIYVGANDGMLHAFDAADGHEDWAFIPEYIQGKLKELTADDCHKYFVDLSPYITDAWFGNSAGDVQADGSNWKTVLIGGNRFGGEEYFALDVTDPAHDQFDVIWDKIPFSGHLSSTIPAVGKVKADDGNVDTWAAIITSGYHGQTQKGRIAALDIKSGDKIDIWRNTSDDDDDDDDDDVSYTDELKTQEKGNRISGSPYYTMSSPVVLDSDLDGYLDLIYAGDTEGSLWKFYYDYKDDVWKQVELFRTGGQWITATPELAFDTDGRLRIYFGTGKYWEESDKANVNRNAFYCIVEEKQTTGDANNGHYTYHPSSPLTPADLTDLTATVTKTQYDNDLDASAQAVASGTGWYFNLDVPSSFPAERVLGKALVVSGVVFFTSFVPNQDVCGFGGNSRLYAVDYIYGVVDEVVLEDAQSGSRHQDIGVGLPSEPVYYFDAETKEPSLFIQKSDSDLEEPRVKLKERLMSINSWKAD